MQVWALVLVLPDHAVSNIFQIWGSKQKTSWLQDPDVTRAACDRRHYVLQIRGISRHL